MKKYLNGFLVVTMLIGIFGINSIFAQGQKPSVIRIGSAYGAGYGKPFSGGIIGIVHIKGLLEEEFRKDGIKIEWYFFKGAGPATNEAYANNTIDFAYQGDLPSIIGKAGGLKTKIIAAGSVRANVYVGVPFDSRITSIKELKGKKVGITKGTNAQLTFNRILAANGLTEKDLNVYNLGVADGEAALTSKDIDAGFYWSGLLNLRTLGTAKIIYSTKQSPDDWKNSGALLVTEDFAGKYPDIVKRVVKKYLEAAKWSSEEKNKNQFFQFLTKGGTPLSTIKEDASGRTLKDINNPLLDKFFYDHYKDGLNFAKEKSLIRKTFDVDKWIDNSYLNSALKELGLENYWQPFGAGSQK
jgi:sulfonate transport system substrate-binding protein